ncbi:MAG TPA: hypothetical protein VEI01_21830 [Terriglobales bacterium]|nr:hypothetical protein [Terriglobales bacterium]
MPAGSIPVCIATLDAVGRIHGITDWRPAAPAAPSSPTPPLPPVMLSTSVSGTTGTIIPATVPPPNTLVQIWQILCSTTSASTSTTATISWLVYVPPGTAPVPRPTTQTLVLDPRP